MERLCRVIKDFRSRHGGITVYLEPGEAVALNAGVLKSTVLDVTTADMPIAILDTSAAAHMPDVLEMPYRPDIIGAGLPGEKAWTCRLAASPAFPATSSGNTLLTRPSKTATLCCFWIWPTTAWSRPQPSTGWNLFAIARVPLDGNPVLVKRFGYEDFKERLS